ncbi:hypothetical protein FEM48_Zijuj08G0157100 [Ziziphus jujuba var. spinosa]|uniref:MULE transposase domain-containing protein n=1 Tax=Ziziphus jujuba var. spinosa TaxID=714518 RepID=A0A978UZZ4_ZIZJJ|nr:hypothetical protein FEM48_Zijuj08G0157100 [Ziziphus jujuba var. spinosa]
MTLFTTQIWHEGHFEFTPSRQYVGGESVHFDNCDPNKWSMIMLADMVQELRYNGFKKLWYLSPGMSVNYGLRQMEDDDNAMHVADLGSRFKVIDIYVEHPEVNSLLADIEGIGGNTSRERNVDYEHADLHDSHVNAVDDTAISSRCVGRIHTRDGENLYDINVDEDDYDWLQECVTVADHLAACSSYGGGVRYSSLIDDEAKLADDNAASVQNDDIGATGVGLADTANEAENALHGPDLVGNAGQYEVIYDSNQLVSLPNSSDEDEVNTHIPVYSTQAKRYFNDFRANPKMKLSTFQDKIKQDLIVDITRSQAYRARETANSMATSDVPEQYSCLWDYCAEIVRSNPKSTCRLKINKESKNSIFQRIYICLATCKEGFKAGCIPFIGLDGCHLKDQHGGQLLTAVGRDPNRQIFLIAYAVVETENKDSWSWFLQYLMEHIEYIDDKNFTFMSDQLKIEGYSQTANRRQDTSSNLPRASLTPSVFGVAKGLAGRGIGRGR